MSEWTSLASKVLQHRHELASGWTTKPENIYRGNSILEARLASVLFSGGAYEAPNGNFAINWSIGTPTGTGRDPRILPLIIFRSIPSSLGAANLDVPYDEYLKDKWFRKDWSYPDLVPEGMHWTYQQFLDRAKRLWYKILTELPWVPNTIAVKVDRAIQIGMLPRMLTTPVWRAQFGPLPSWLQSPYRQAAWDELVSVLGVLNRDVSSANIEGLKAEADRLEANRQFWDSVAKYSGVDLIAEQWAKLKAKVREFKISTGVARDTVNRLKAMQAADPGGYTGDQRAQVQALEQEISQNVAGIRSQMPSSILSALQDEGDALGIAPLVAIGIGAAIIAAAAGVAVAWASQANATARKAMDLESEFLAQAEASADEAFSREQESILAEEANTQQLYDSGEISQTDYNNRMGNLQSRRQSNMAALAQRRAQTQDILATHHQNMATLQKEAGGTLANMKGIIKWGVLGVGLLMVGPSLIRRLR